MTSTGNSLAKTPSSVVKSHEAPPSDDVAAHSVDNDVSTPTATASTSELLQQKLEQLVMWQALMAQAPSFSAYEEGAPGRASAAGGDPNIPLTPQENGSGDTTAAVVASGDQNLDALLSGVRWADGFITYSDPDSVADYQAGHPEAFSNFQQVNASQMVAVHFGLNSAVYTQLAASVGFSVEGFTNLGIDYAGAGSGAGTIRVANTSNPGTAYAYYPHNGVAGGDAFFGGSGRNPTAGNYDWHTVLHELGHSLGLKHGHETGGFGAMTSDRDSLEFSIMTYRTFIGDDTSGYNYGTWDAPQTFMMYDIAALQYMYGADYTANSGDTVYTWDPNNGTSFINGDAAIQPGGNRIFTTIWDGGGVDTYDLSNYSTNLVIDLNPGGWSTFSSAQLANLGGGPNGGFARGNVANALLFGGNTASLIENAYGGSGNDVITGNQGNNSIKGQGGIDTLYGGNGNDTLMGSEGAGGGSETDYLYGGNGGDSLYGDGGNDYLYGGNDGDSVYGGGGDDYVLGDASINGDAYYGGSGTDVYDVSSYVWAVDVTIDLNAELWSYSAGSETVSGFENIWGSSQLNVTETLTGNAVANSIYGGGGGLDIIQGLAGNDFLYGGAGIDWAYGGTEDDYIDGGAGADWLYGGDNNDTIYAGNDSDVDNVYGGGGDDTIYWINDVNIDNHYGGDGSDTINADGIDFGAVEFNMITGYYLFVGGSNQEVWSGFENYYNANGAGNERVIGTNGANIITTGSGNNFVDDGAAGDTVNLGAGDDTLRLGDANINGDVYDGGTGTDTFDASHFNWGTAVTIDLTAGTWSYSAGSESVLNFENIRGAGNSSSIETLRGNGVANEIYGNGGNDVLEGLGGGDFLYGGDSDDSLNGGIGADLLDGGNGNDTATYASAAAGVFASLANSAINTGEAAGDTYVSVESLTGTSFNDRLWGNGGANTLSGGALDDLLHGGAGADFLFGGSGIDGATYWEAAAGVIASLENNALNTGDATGDTYSSIENLYGSAFGDRFYGDSGVNALIGNDGDDLLHGGVGADALYGGNGIDGAAYWNAAAGVFASLANAAINTGDAAGDTYFSIENLYGSGFNDRLYGNSGANALVGNNGDDLLHGGAGADALYGGNGTDGATYWEATAGVIASLANSAINTGHAAGDTYSSIENLYGSGFNDRLYGNSGVNALVGNDGDDLLHGGAGADALFGGNGIDGATYWDALAGVNASLLAPAGNTGEAAGDTYNSIENLYGSAFDDQLRGDNNVNALVGNNGSDILYGFGGLDSLYGGAGIDHLVGGLGDDRLWGGTEGDIFYGVNDNGRDRILDWQDGVDRINMVSVSGVSSFANISVVNGSVDGTSGALVYWNGVDGFWLVGRLASTVDASDFIF